MLVALGWKAVEKEILKHLRKGGYISGQDLAKSLGVSRTAIWKHIRNLRKKGYQINSSTRLGYSLKQAPDLLTPEEIQTGLATNTFGRAVHYFEEVASTQDQARQLAENGAEEGTLVTAEAQVGGRGRRGRLWISPPSTGIYLSLILRPDIEPFKIAQIPIVVGIGVCESIAQVTGLNSRLKWPNDVLIEGKKVAGILTEMSAEPDRVHYIIVGIGINVNTPASSLPGDLQATATSLFEAAGHYVSRRALVQKMLTNLEAGYEEFKLANFDAFRERWRQLDQTIDSWVTITDASGSFVGYAMDIDKDGALIVKDKQNKVRRVLAGDATLRGNITN